MSQIESRTQAVQPEQSGISIQLQRQVAALVASGAGETEWSKLHLPYLMGRELALTFQLPEKFISLAIEQVASEQSGEVKPSFKQRVLRPLLGIFGERDRSSDNSPLSPEEVERYDRWLASVRGHISNLILEAQSEVSAALASPDFKAEQAQKWQESGKRAQAAGRVTEFKTNIIDQEEPEFAAVNAAEVLAARDSKVEAFEQNSSGATASYLLLEVVPTVHQTQPKADTVGAAYPGAVALKAEGMSVLPQVIRVDIITVSGLPTSNTYDLSADAETGLLLATEAFMQGSPRVERMVTKARLVQTNEPIVSFNPVIHGNVYG